ncbi:hypothetical protein CAOG_009829 [Capsaspora owczarzaki ATCC 30864]|uniref:Uncharacterized protein n=1 Tax=Capsaspora owczarzaki (strain ATCC 30864) TaxID=595528 RepID=A0A0D2WRP5_CAPO3|nr:hypothetical protein CAOG_009829 [Capsaspora owczarzaki ATCC 30864]
MATYEHPTASFKPPGPTSTLRGYISQLMRVTEDNLTQDLHHAWKWAGKVPELRVPLDQVPWPTTDPNVVDHTIDALIDFLTQWKPVWGCLRIPNSEQSERDTVANVLNQFRGKRQRVLERQLHQELQQTETAEIS